MRAVNNYIIVEKIKQGPKKVGGLILTEDVDADNRYIKANVCLLYTSPSPRD